MSLKPVLKTLYRPDLTRSLPYLRNELQRLGNRCSVPVVLVPDGVCVHDPEVHGEDGVGPGRVGVHGRGRGDPAPEKKSGSVCNLTHSILTAKQYLFIYLFSIFTNFHGYLSMLKT